MKESSCNINKLKDTEAAKEIVIFIYAQTALG